MAYYSNDKMVYDDPIRLFSDAELSCKGANHAHEEHQQKCYDMTQFSQNKLIQIIEKASTIAERLMSDFIPVNDEQFKSKLSELRLEKWRLEVSGSDHKFFERLLVWEGLDLNMAQHLIGPVRKIDNTVLPSWAKTLEEIIEHATVFRENVRRSSKADQYRFLDQNEPLPFEEILVPMVQYASQRLANRTGSANQQLSNKAHGQLERSLLKVLSDYSSFTLYLEFSVFRIAQQSPLDRLLEKVQKNVRCDLYRNFVEQMLRGGLTSLFSEYAVLGRLMATLINLWVETNTEFLLHLAQDQGRIKRSFNNGNALGQVTDINSMLSDPHRGGHTVMALTFSSGLKLVYKPKDLSMEETYSDLLIWFNEHHIPLQFKVLKVINQFTHGWVEFVEHHPCKDELEAARFYKRAGMLTCLVYVLEGNDCHYENLIAYGEYPVLIDVETLLHPRVRPNVDTINNARNLANEKIKYSVLRTGLLPKWEVKHFDKVAYDLSGLGIHEDIEAYSDIIKWGHLNSDSMALTWKQVAKTPKANAPFLNDKPLKPDDYLDEIIDGFELMYRYLMERRETFLASNDSPLKQFDRQEVRFLFRDTTEYEAILCKLRYPERLRDGADWSITLETLKRILISSNTKPLCYSIIKAELRAMTQLDIPFFTASTAFDSLHLEDGQTIPNFFIRSSFDSVKERWATLNETDLRQQIAYIRETFSSKTTKWEGISIGARNLEIDLDSLEPVSPQELVDKAISIAEELKQYAIVARDGSATWIAPEYIHQVKRYQVQPLGNDLYSGICGIALFLAALERVTLNGTFRDLALGALKPLREKLNDSESNRRLLKHMGLGGIAGLGSVIYAMVLISQLLDESTLIEDAKRASTSITLDAISSDDKLDIIAGTAGTILGLLVLYQVIKDQALIDRLVACGQHLLMSRAKSATGYRAWITIKNNPPLTGFSHGAAGIAYALLRLYEVTTDMALLDAAREAILYEASVFCAKEGNWPVLKKDVQHEDNTKFMNAWCHGAPGICLARLGGLSILNTPDICRDIETALKTTLRFGVWGADHLCCGNLGRIDVLLTAAQMLKRIEILDIAYKWAKLILTKAERKGHFILNSDLYPGIHFPGFFQGTSGIGYELLRLARPDIIPSVLLLA